MDKHAIVAGSFDPITNGHVWLIKEALALTSKLTVIVGINPKKKYTFDAVERCALVDAVLRDELSPEDYARVNVSKLENDLLVSAAASLGATHIIRGIRNIADFNAEYELMLVNGKIDPSIRHAYVLTPPNMADVSSSTVKGLVGLVGWESHVKRYVNPLVVAGLKQKQG